jgi:hypothetical protein
MRQPRWPIEWWPARIRQRIGGWNARTGVAACASPVATAILAPALGIVTVPARRHRNAPEHRKGRSVAPQPGPARPLRALAAPELSATSSRPWPGSPLRHTYCPRDRRSTAGSMFWSSVLKRQFWRRKRRRSTRPATGEPRDNLEHVEVTLYAAGATFRAGRRSQPPPSAKPGRGLRLRVGHARCFRPAGLVEKVSWVGFGTALSAAHRAPRFDTPPSAGGKGPFFAVR